MQLEVGLRTPGMTAPERICATNFKYMYWSSVQQLVHHASSGCAMNVGDLLGSGTISGPEKHQRGSLLEISWNGTEPLQLPGGATRTFLEDGDCSASTAGVRAPVTASASAKSKAPSCRRCKPQRSAGGIFLICAECAAMSSRL